MKIALVSQLFWPEVGAPSARGLEMARVWRDQGHQVKIVTAFPNHPTGVIPEEYRGQTFMVEDVEGLEVFRSFIYATPNEGFIRRVLSHLSFMASSVVQTLPRLGDVDIIVATSPPFFPVISSLVFSLAKQVPFIFEVRDLWPGVFEELGVIENPAVLGLLEQVELALYKRASRVVVVTDSFVEDIAGRGIPEGKIEVVKNGVDLDFFRAVDGGNIYRDEFGVEADFIVSYLGTHGISQALTSHIEAAEHLADRDDIAFVFVGQGAEKDDLRALATEKGLEHVHFFGNQPKKRMPQLYSHSDACFVPLRDIPMFSSFIPSKIFEILACETPVIGSVRGEAAELLRDSGAAIVTDPENTVGLVDAVVELEGMTAQERDDMGAAGRRFATERFSRTSLAKKYIDIFRDILAEK